MIKFLIPLTGVVLLILATNIVSAQTKGKTKKRTTTTSTEPIGDVVRPGVSFTLGRKDYSFPENSQEYIVSFPQKPLIKSAFTENHKGTEASLILSDCFLRAESFGLSVTESEMYARMDDESLSKLILAFAKNHGLSSSFVTVERNDKGIVVSLRANKIINDKPVTYETKFYYGRSSILAVSVGALSSIYPTDATFQFLKSVQRDSHSETRKVPSLVSGGVVNGRAVRLIQPEYPSAAKAVRAEGTVNVQVTYDENGNVISVSATSGHPLLRAAAVQAARASKFTPVRLSGQPVKVTGVIVYNFVAPEEPNDEN